ncbi:MAG: peptidase inhibitor family I36 protein, partial [Micrococcales bacterium]|nr:peptidase inhibitor family I36 protein [Micrococcales bacterium]
MRLPAILAAVTVTAAGLVGLQAEPSQAASRDGICEKGEFCYYYNSNLAGSVSDFTGSLADYGTSQPSCYEFKGAGNGKGRCILNDAASVRNNTTYEVWIYTGKNYTGSVEKIAPNSTKQLTTTYNRNASHKFVTPTTTTPAPSSSPCTGSRQGTYNAPVNTKLPFGSFNTSTGSDGKSWYGQHDVPVATGTAVCAIADGTVSYQQAYTVINGVKKLTSYGNNVRFTSSDGKVKAVYAHLNSFSK